MKERKRLQLQVKQNCKNAVNHSRKFTTKVEKGT